PLIRNTELSPAAGGLAAAAGVPFSASLSFSLLEELLEVPLSDSSLAAVSVVLLGGGVEPLVGVGKRSAVGVAPPPSPRRFKGELVPANKPSGVHRRARTSLCGA